MGQVIIYFVNFDPKIKNYEEYFLYICKCVSVCVCVFWKMDKALAQVSYILFSDIHHQIKQITKIKNAHYLHKLLKLTYKKSKLKRYYVCVCNDCLFNVICDFTWP